VSSEPGAIETDDLAARLDDPGLVLLDVRTTEEFEGVGGYACDPRQGHIPGARHVPVIELLTVGPEDVRERLALAEDVEVVAYCHSGGRSALAVSILRAAGLTARNYEASWHEWSRRNDLPAERTSPG
jgi:thiosulfate/3-mercaptopyruvate sulfurtransferase